MLHAASSREWLAAEVVTLPVLTRVPGAPVHVLGVLAHRGEVVPVVDIVMLFSDKPDKAPRRAVVVKSHKGNVALTAEKVNGLTNFEGSFDTLGDAGARFSRRRLIDSLGRDSEGSSEIVRRLGHSRRFYACSGLFVFVVDGFGVNLHTCFGLGVVCEALCFAPYFYCH